MIEENKNYEKITLEKIIEYINKHPLPKQTNNGVITKAIYFYPSLKNILSIRIEDILNMIQEKCKNRLIKILRGKMLEFYIIYYLRSKGFNVKYDYRKDYRLGIDFTINKGKVYYFYVGADSEFTRKKLRKLTQLWKRRKIFVNIILYGVEDVEEVNGWIIPKPSFITKILEAIKNESR